MTRAPLAVLAHLARQRLWVIATGISFCAMLLHAVALQLGSIVLVQPLMLVGVLGAVLVRSALEHAAPRWCELRAVGVTSIGLAGFILSASPRASGAQPTLVVTGAVALTCFALGLCALRSGGSRSVGSPARRAATLGCGAGVMFGATAGLLKIVGLWAMGGSDPLSLTGAVAALVASGLLGTAMNQRAYQIAPLSCSMPVVNVVDIMVAVAFGALALGELPGHSATIVGLQLASLACVGIGLRLISALQGGQAEAVTQGPGSVTVGTRRGPGGLAEPSGRLDDVTIRGAVS